MLGNGRAWIQIQLCRTSKSTDWTTLQIHVPSRLYRGWAHLSHIRSTQPSHRPMCLLTPSIHTLATSHIVFSSITKPTTIPVSSFLPGLRTMCFPPADHKHPPKSRELWIEFERSRNLDGEKNYVLLWIQKTNRNGTCDFVAKRNHRHFCIMSPLSQISQNII